METIIFNRRAIPAGAVNRQEDAGDGWPLRTFEWPVEVGVPRGTMLFQGGRGDIFEKYLEAFDHWHRRGWHIASFDWRGQGGSGRLAADPHVGHVEDFATWVDELAERFAALKARTPEPHVVVAHSMGGHIVLRALIERRIAPDAVVLVAPMLGLRSTPFSQRMAAWIARLMTRIGRPERPAWKANERPTLPGASRQKFLTHSIERYDDELWWKEQRPELILGPPSWQWLAAAYRSTLDSFAPGRLESVNVPILLLCAEDDQLVSPPATIEAASRLPDARLIRFGAESAHEILREADPVRERALGEIDRFLEERAAAR